MKDNMIPENELLNFFFKISSWQMNRCLAPGVTCPNKAIRAHSIQNAVALDLLCRDGHVKAISKRVDKEKGMIICFDDIGRNIASTFTGLCSDHDADIFRPIDTEIFDYTNIQHLFLFAYRAVLKGLHASLDSAIRIQSAYNKRVELGLDDADAISLAGMLGVEYIIKAYEMNLYKEKYDNIFLLKIYNNITHKIFSIEHDRPTVAVGSLFSLDGVIKDSSWVNVSLNIVPISTNQSIVVFSFLEDDADLVCINLQRILETNGYYQKYELSKLILNNCENFVLSPDYYDSWTNKKKETVIGYFEHTLLSGDLSVENDLLYLF